MTTAATAATKATTETRQIRLSKENADWLRAEATRHDRSGNWFINKAIEQMRAARELDGTQQVLRVPDAEADLIG